MDIQDQESEKEKKRDEFMAKMKLLPDFVYEALFMNDGIQANIQISEKYKLSDQQNDEMLDINSQIAFREIPIEKIPDELERRLRVDAAMAKQIASDLLTKKFFLAKSFFPGIEDEILKLGGQIPKEVPQPISQQFIKREEEIEELEQKKEEEEAERKADAIENDYVGNLLKKYPQLGEMIIGTQKAIEVKGMDAPMKPMIKYWVHDYMEKTGYYRHDNLDRVQYVCHDKNTRSMNDEERRELNLILKSMDNEITLPYSTKREKIDFSLVPEEE